MNSGKSCIVNVCTNHCKLTLDCELLYRYVSQLANSEICFRKDRRQRDRFSPNSPMVSDSASSVSNARSQQFYKTSHWSKSTIHFFPVSQCWTCSVRIKPSNLNSFPDTKNRCFCSHSVTIRKKWDLWMWFCISFRNLPWFLFPRIQLGLEWSSQLDTFQKCDNLIILIQ